jgi:hypothetical protein
MLGASEEMRVEHLQNNALEIVYAICSVISQPVEIILRPWYGTRYFPAPIQFFSAAMMIIAPGILSLFSNFMGMIPLLQAPRFMGMFSLGDYASLYFMICAVHGFRTWRRMIQPAREQHSRFEGSALPIFAWLPKGGNFWWVRLLYEPVLVLAASISLQDLFIIQSPLVLYLRFATLALFVKNYIAWFRSYEVMRDVLDDAAMGPAMGRIMENKATEEDRVTFHLARLPENLDPGLRKTATRRLVREYMPDYSDLNTKGDENATH